MDKDPTCLYAYRIKPTEIPKVYKWKTITKEPRSLASPLNTALSLNKTHFFVQLSHNIHLTALASMFCQIRETAAETICLTLLTYNKVWLNTVYWKCLGIFTWELQAAVLTQADLPLMSVGIAPG